ncbi:hypothetical protein BK809_0003888 [Diplodia seriata]|uniref:Alpha/beta hydrolase fold-3 domain-containing protein n=1 Tax=Diplodia seriata TaxID=420778 RepID=A0A1S8BCJ0_9PEZI|nr:hypothetical protein BK809_0003888 [Diplodia seriata]
MPSPQPRVNGTRLHAPWFPPYLLTYAIAHSATIVSPDYRLLPEASGLDILSDISSLWSWLFTSLHAYLLLKDPLNTPCGVDLGQIMVSGESAGGWLAIQSALMHPNRIKVILGIFPMLDLGDEHFTRGGRRNINVNTSCLHDEGAPSCTTVAKVPTSTPSKLLLRETTDRASQAKQIVGVGALLDARIIDEHIAAAARARSTHHTGGGGGVISSVTPPARAELSLALFQHGRLGELLGGERELYPLEVLEDKMTMMMRRRCDAAGGGNKTSRFLPPPLCVIHGTDDTVVPVQGSRRFCRAWEKTWRAQQLCDGRAIGDGGAVVKLVLRPGEHGFEATASEEEDGWLREALGWVADRWLS